MTGGVVRAVSARSSLQRKYRALEQLELPVMSSTTTMLHSTSGAELWVHQNQKTK